MRKNFEDEYFNTLSDALERYQELSKRYKDVRLEQFVIFENNVYWVIRYRYER